uniref:Complex 1 LYR protein domain-containing protein n=1 Tax=Ciona savignyi TaxID=51511 RepID=H2ZR62_CIOSA
SKLYKQLITECAKFSDYNFRSHALRRVKHAYETHLSETDETKIANISKKMKEDIESTSRQVTIGHLFAAERHILDKNNT